MYYVGIHACHTIDIFAIEPVASQSVAEDIVLVLLRLLQASDPDLCLGAWSKRLAS